MIQGATRLTNVSRSGKQRCNPTPAGWIRALRIFFRLYFVFCYIPTLHNILPTELRGGMALDSLVSLQRYDSAQRHVWILCVGLGDALQGSPGLQRDITTIRASSREYTSVYPS
jgi:hypothetical protein